MLLGGHQVAGEQRSRTCSLAQHTADRQRIADRPGFLEVAFDHTHGLVRKALEPQDPGLEIVRLTTRWSN